MYIRYLTRESNLVHFFKYIYEAKRKSLFDLKILKCFVLFLQPICYITKRINIPE